MCLSDACNIILTLSLFTLRHKVIYMLITGIEMDNFYWNCFITSLPMMLLFYSSGMKQVSLFWSISKTLGSVSLEHCLKIQFYVCQFNKIFNTRFYLCKAILYIWTNIASLGHDYCMLLHSCNGSSFIFKWFVITFNKIITWTLQQQWQILQSS